MITRLTRRYSRRALARPNLAYWLWRFAANGARTYRAMTTAVVHSDVPAIANELTERGIVVGPSDGFLSEAGQQALADASRNVLQASRSAEVEAIVSGAASAQERQKEFLVHLVSYPQGIPADDPLLKVALDEKLLEIVSSYLGFWPCLHSVSAWLNYPTDAPPQISQLWHRDPEDLSLIKAFIYLTDVDEHCGPFTYIPRTHPFGAAAADSQTIEKKKRVPDDRMHLVFPPEAWRVCTGPAGTMILADTLGYHRGGKTDRWQAHPDYVYLYVGNADYRAFHSRRAKANVDLGRHPAACGEAAPGEGACTGEEGQEEEKALTTAADRTLRRLTHAIQPGEDNDSAGDADIQPPPLCHSVSTAVRRAVHASCSRTS